MHRLCNKKKIGLLVDRTEEPTVASLLPITNSCFTEPHTITFRSVLFRVLVPFISVPFHLFAASQKNMKTHLNKLLLTKLR